MFVTRVNFGSANAANAPHREINRRSMSDSQKLDILVRKMNTLQMDVEKMRARQMLADKVIATGMMNLLSVSDCPLDEYHDLHEEVQILNKMA